MSFANFNPAEFIGDDVDAKNTQLRNPFLTIATTPTSQQPLQKKEREEHIPRLSIHKHIVERLDEFIAKNQIPHIIFHGPSGSGKQTIVREFIQRIYGGDKIKMKTHVMTVNCSHGKGIQFIRDELKFFAKANAQTKSNVEGGKSSDFKVIMLLNAHHLTVDAQSALRRCIELFSYNTRFFIVVENKDKLLNPILSRFCDIFVPEPRVDDVSINLHTYVLSQQFRIMNEQCREVKSNKFSHEQMRSAYGLPSGYSAPLGESSHSVMSYACTSVMTSVSLRLRNCPISVIERVFSDGNEPLFAFMQKINHLYELGISCLDLMEWIKTRRDIWSETEYYRAVMRFYQIKPQFRCEKLLMLFMMNYLHSH